MGSYQENLDCEIEDCDEVATVVDENGNFLCEDCMLKEIEESGTVAEDYESV